MRRLLVVLPLGAVLACSSFETDSTGTGKDAGPAEAGSSSGSSSGSSGGGDGGTGPDQSSVTPPLLAAGFEDADVCGSWLAVNSTKTRETDTPHSGSAACSVCVNGSGSYSFHGPSFDSSAVAGDVFNASVWLRSRTDVSNNARLVIHAVDSTSGVQLIEGQSTTATVHEDWLEIKATLKVPTSALAGAMVDAYVAVDNAGADTCVLVDDFSVVKQ